MLIELVFLGSLALVAIQASYKIYASEFALKEKTNAVTAIFGILSLMIIFNAARHQNYITFDLIGSSQNAHPSLFFNLPSSSQALSQQPSIPLISSRILSIEKALFGNQNKNIGSFFILSSNNNNNQEASAFLKEYCSSLVKNNHPALYIFLSKQILNKNDLESFLYGFTLEQLETEVEQLNRLPDQYPPVIVIDNAQLALPLYGIGEFNNLLIETLARMQFKSNLQVIIHSKLPSTMQLFQQIPGVQEVAEIKTFPIIQPQQALEFLIELSPLKVTNSTETMQQLVEAMNQVNIEFSFLSQFILNDYKNIPELVQTILKQHKEQVNRDPVLKNCLESFRDVLNVQTMIPSGENILRLGDFIIKSKTKSPKECITSLKKAEIVSLENGFLSLKKESFNALFV